MVSLTGSSEKPRAWSRFAKDSSAYIKLHPEEVKKEIKKEKDEVKKKEKKDKKGAIQDPKVKELLEKVLAVNPYTLLELLFAKESSGGNRRLELLITIMNI